MYFSNFSSRKYIDFDKYDLVRIVLFPSCSQNDERSPSKEGVFYEETVDINPSSAQEENVYSQLGTKSRGR